ncbi:MAG: 2-oxo acid dehydrogenase subunit E2 [Deltaproteobacteria bacterium]|nr:2-oxo acid dehydrogenase subunit E2 [Deltaproteobacteria bacterium]
MIRTSRSSSLRSTTTSASPWIRPRASSCRSCAARTNSACSKPRRKSSVWPPPRARKKLAAQDFQGGTFTLTNIGPVGGTFATPIINYPEVAILGIFRMTERPVVRDGRIVVRKIMPLVLSFDHRVADGADAARFVNHVKAMLEEPEVMLVRA